LGFKSILSNTFLNTLGIIKKNYKKLEKYFELNENKNKAYQNVWNAVKDVSSGKFVSLHTLKRIKITI